MVCINWTPAQSRPAAFVSFSLESESWPTSKLTQAEVATIDRLQKKGTTPGEVLKTLRRSRRENGGVGPGKTAIYDFMNGTTHKRGAAERRGRKSRVPPGILTVANTERRKLIKKAKKGAVFPFKS